ncbi:MAG: 50S ribosomal protein L6 [Chloroflexi bacterium RBG_13_52_12]|nr:MAG: 50S ribosomal protein L6 [Chloroflexi bacterium RBG_13_52_12]
MSRIGKLPITVPSGVKVNIAGANVTVTGPKGELKRSLPTEMGINLEGSILTVTRPSDAKRHRAFHGLTRSLLANMVQGVSKGFEKNLEIVGVGYRVEKTGEKITLRLGFSHQVEVNPKPGVSLAVEGTNKIKVSGINKEDVGEMAAEIRALRPPDHYKGKGIRYAGEKVHLKPGKAGKVVGRK